MAFFGKNDEELKKFEIDLNKRQNELNNWDVWLKSEQSKFEHEKSLIETASENLKTERANHADEVKRISEAIASEMAELERRRSEISLIEAKAKSGFAEEQRAIFEEVVIKRQSELDARRKNLDSLADEIAKQMGSLHSRESDIARRELAVTEREQKADAGFADKTRALADEATRQHHANQAEAERLRNQADTLAEERQQLEAAKAALVSREAAVVTAEQQRDAGFADERAAVNNELRDQRMRSDSQLANDREKKISAIEDEITCLRKNRMEEIVKAGNAERGRIHGEIEAEREAWAKQLESDRKHLESERQQLESVRMQLENERADLEKHKGALSALQSELEGRKVELDTSERALERKEQRLERTWQKRNDELTDEVESRLSEERRSMESEKQALMNENARLRESIRIQMELVGAFDHLKQQLGDRDPTDILRELNSKSDELKRLREDLATRPSEEMRERYQALDSEAKTQKARAEALARQLTENNAAVAEVDDLRRKNSDLSAENRSLAHKASIFEGAANEAQAELERLRKAYERPKEVAERYKEIEMPHIAADKVKEPKKDDSVDEMTWLTGVGNACDSYGFHFHPRILKAFHTALKTSEWSPVTILAGVSGTGKSELPRLYSHFGGLMFEPLSVQPNWDSQESMLGFFNSIDNKFDAQPVLRFLAQSQKKWINNTDDEEGYPGLQDAVCLVLLDEMNLAHPELYFAEFLSKLELRRGMKGSNPPWLSVKIGAGLPPYQLPLGRNVLWTGTMNQDETTKALSDKVLDRSIIIHFPRPTELKRRLKLTPLDEKNRGPLLHKAAWQSWLALGSSFSEEDVKPFLCFIQDMNKALAVAGRAIGHRVWQSVEYYMANYPDVRVAQKAGDQNALNEALHIAFEDQLVQKVMPKLRGIDTRGKSMTDCLEKIRDQINLGIGGNSFKLAEDFNLACELGYGQFIWQSANYLAEMETNSCSPASTASNGETGGANRPPLSTAASGSVDTSAGRASAEKVVNADPPASFMPKDPIRNDKWQRLSEEKKQKYLSSGNKEAI